MKFVILGHLMKGEDLKMFFPFGKYLPVKLMETLISFLPAKKSFIKLSHFNVLGRAEGWMLGVALTPWQMMNLPKEKVRAKILEAVLFAQNKLGAEVLMLGALTSPLTSAGLWLKENPKVKLNINNGNTCTAVISIMAAEKAVELANLDFSTIKMAIVGAAGAIAEPIVKYFHEKGVDLILIERTKEKFDRLKPCFFRANYELSCDISKIKEADVVITATSHPTALIRPDILKQNAIVVDVAEPHDVPANISELRPDVICIDGGRVNWGDIDLKMDLGLPKNIGFACMTDVILQSLEEKKVDYIGSVSQEHIQEIRKWLLKWDFRLADFTSFNKPIPVEKFRKIKH